MKTKFFKFSIGHTVLPITLVLALISLISLWPVFTTASCILIASCVVYRRWASKEKVFQSAPGKKVIAFDAPTDEKKRVT